jgi:hypothetical protein
MWRVVVIRKCLSAGRQIISRALSLSDRRHSRFQIFEPDVDLFAAGFNVGLRRRVRRPIPASI